MKIESIEYEELFPTGAYANQRYRAVASIEEGDDTTKCYGVLKDAVGKAFVELNPQISWHLPESTTEVPIIQKTNEEKKSETIDGFKEAIKLCRSKESLEKLFKKLAENTPELTEAFENKLKEFK